MINLKLNPEWIKILSIAILPGILISIISHNLIWLSASFLAACSALPYGSRITSSWASLGLVALLSLLALMIKHLIYINSLSLILGLLCGLGLLAGVLENIDEKLRSFSSWLIIGALYGGVKLSTYNVSWLLFLAIISLSLLSVLLVTILIKPEQEEFKFKLNGIFREDFLFNFKYCLPICVMVILWHYYQIQEPQWLIWSSLSVSYTKADKVKNKFKERMIGDILGVSCGLIVGIILPTNQIITYLAFIGIILSLRMFEEYLPGFILRSFLIVLYAANNGVEVAFFRYLNVLIGGIIGVICSLGLIYLANQYWLKESNSKLNK